MRPVFVDLSVEVHLLVELEQLEELQSIQSWKDKLTVKQLLVIENRKQLLYALLPRRHICFLDIVILSDNGSLNHRVFFDLLGLVHHLISVDIQR